MNITTTAAKRQRGFVIGLVLGGFPPPYASSLLRQCKEVLLTMAEGPHLALLD